MTKTFEKIGLFVNGKEPGTYFLQNRVLFHETGDWL